MLHKISDSLTAPVVIAAIVGGVIGFAGSVGLHFITRPPPPDPDGEVLSPETGEQLAPSFTAHGRLDHIPESEHVWVAVQRGDLLFPKEPEIPRGDRAWVHEFQEGEAAEVAGDDIAAGEGEFSLVLLLVDPDRQAEIETWFAEAEHTGDYPGFEVGAEGFRRLDAVRDLSLLPPPPPPPLTFPLQANEAASPGSVKNRTEASDGTTVLLQDGQTASWVFEIPRANEYRLGVRYSNDNFGPLETVTVSLGGDLVGDFQAEDTGDYGSGWNIFVNSPPLGPHRLEAGEHELTVSVTGGDGYGVEIDHVDSLD
jgi:hypothetical protein